MYIVDIGNMDQIHVHCTNLRLALVVFCVLLSLVYLSLKAPSDKPDFAAFLVENGIESISLTPDSVLTAIGVVADAERKLDVQQEIKDTLSKESAAAVKKKVGA